MAKVKFEQTKKNSHKINSESIKKITGRYEFQ